jgi:uncharacterized tellurite resistance protein B-like protein
VRELLTKYKYPGDKTPIIRGSALKAMTSPDDPEATNRIINESFVWYMDSRDQNKIGQEIENNLHLFNGFNEDHRKAILNDMIQIIKADGNIDPQETKFFKAIADCLGVDLG